MKKIFLLIFLFICNLAYTQSFTTVTATLTDSSTQVWTNAIVIAALQPSPGNPAQPLNQGHPITDSPQTTTTDGTGTFTLVLDDNNKITPTGSRWVFTMCPDATVTRCSSGLVFVTGTTQNLSTTLNSYLLVPAVSAAPSVNRAYDDSEATGGSGGLYWNTTQNVLRGCVLTGGTCVWNTIGNIGVPGVSGNIPFNCGGGIFCASANLNYNNNTSTLTLVNLAGTAGVLNTLTLNTSFKIGAGQSITAYQGSTGTKLFICTGAFVSGNLVISDANGNCADSGNSLSGIFASPPAIGTGTPAAGTFTTVASTSITTSTLTGIPLVGTGTNWTGSDVCAQINTAYANGIPSRGGRIRIVDGDYNCSTPVVIGTASKPLKLECNPETTLTWTPTTGTMFTFNYGNASTLHDRSGGMIGCSIVGPVSGTAQGFVLGGTNGCEGFTLQDTKVTWTVGTAFTYGNNTFATKFDHSSIIAQVGANFPVGVSSGGEDIEWRNTLFQGVTSGYVGCVTVSNAGLALNVIGGSFDDCQFVSGFGVVQLVGTHFENPGQRSDSTSNPAASIGSNTTLTGTTFFQDAVAATKSQEVLVTGGANVSFFGVGVTSNAVIANFVTNSGTGSVLLAHGPQNFGNYTAVANATSSGNVIDMFSNGAAGPLVTIFNSSGSRGVFMTNGPLEISHTTFALVATCDAGHEGMMAGVTDSTTNVWGATIAGSGANHVLGYCDGTNLTVAGK